MTTIAKGDDDNGNHVRLGIGYSCSIYFCSWYCWIVISRVVAFVPLGKQQREKHGIVQHRRGFDDSEEVVGYILTPPTMASLPVNVTSCV